MENPNPTNFSQSISNTLQFWGCVYQSVVISVSNEVSACFLRLESKFHSDIVWLALVLCPRLVSYGSLLLWKLPQTGGNVKCLLICSAYVGISLFPKPRMCRGRRANQVCLTPLTNTEYGTVWVTVTVNRLKRGVWKKVLINSVIIFICFMTFYPSAISRISSGDDVI